MNPNGSVTLQSLNDKGKISSTDDGIVYYYTPWDSTKPLQLTAKVHVDAYEAGNNQRAFGLMLRNTVGVHGNTSGHRSNLVAVGSENQKMVAFYKTGAPDAIQMNRFILINKVPSNGEEYTLRLIKREDNKAVVSINVQTTVIDTTGMFTDDKFYIGLFTARKATVTYSDIELLTNVEAVNITSQPEKTEYLVGEELDLTGLAVSAQYEGGSSAVLSANDYIITGFDMNTVGAQTVTINYGGKTASFQINVIPLTCLHVEVEYLPAKTTY